ncbi:MAG TPA: hypothetical protein VM867_08240 [Xanthobacteraceae bacterium]|nr:hypothetical protein [Xanthobacteraceae bacterium]
MSCAQFIAQAGALLPVNADAHVLANRGGATIHVEEIYPRDIVFHRRVFATIGDLARAIGVEPEWLRAQLLVYCGLFHIVGTLEDKQVVAVASMRRNAMKDEELHAFWQDSKDHIVARVLPLVGNEVTRERLHQAVESF